jgi:hypothetical protein
VSEVGITALTVPRSKGFGRQKGHTSCIAVRVRRRFPAQIKIEIASPVRRSIGDRAFVKAARTGKIVTQELRQPASNRFSYSHRETKRSGHLITCPQARWSERDGSAVPLSFRMWCIARRFFMSLPAYAPSLSKSFDDPAKAGNFLRLRGSLIRQSGFSNYSVASGIS